MSAENTDKQNIDLKSWQEQLDHQLALQLQNIPQFYPPPNAMPPLPPPFEKKKKDKIAPSPEAVSRIITDYKGILKAKNPYIHASIDEEDVTHVNLLIIGPPETPYADGFFHFEAFYPHDYPWHPPSVSLKTTGRGTVRFNPNLYANGKVCLSILGTWEGPGWTSVQTMLSTFMSIQSLMNPAPYHNEPGHERERCPGDAEKYSEYIKHETLRVAVCEMMEHPTWENMEEFDEIMKNHFIKNYQNYVDLATSKLPQDGTPLVDSLFPANNNAKFNYESILNRLKKIKQYIDEDRFLDLRKDVPAPEIAPPLYPMPMGASPLDSFGSPSPFPMSPPISIFSNFLQPPSIKAVPTQIDLDAELAATLQFSSPHIAFEVKAEEGGAAPSPFYPYPSIFASKFGLEPPKWHAQMEGKEAKEGDKKEEEAKKVKPPSRAEISKTAEEEMNVKVTGNECLCIVCHKETQEEYVTLPNCSQPHIYCVGCAEKLVERGNTKEARYLHGRKRNRDSTNNNIVRVHCLLCKCITEVDSKIGIRYYRKRKNRFPLLEDDTKEPPLKRTKTENEKQAPPKCPEHGEEFILFCISYMQLMCPECLKRDDHTKHTDDIHVPLHEAESKIHSILDKELTELKSKQNSIKQFIQTLSEKKPQIKISKEENIQKLKSEIDKLTTTLKQKLSEMENQIAGASGNKEMALDREIVKAQKLMVGLDEAVNLIQDCQKEKDFRYLAKVENTSADIRNQSNITAPNIKKSMYTLAPVNLRFLEVSLKHLKYKDWEHKVDHPMSFVDYEEMPIFSSTLPDEEMDKFIMFPDNEPENDIESESLEEYHINPNDINPNPFF